MRIAARVVHSREPRRRPPYGPEPGEPGTDQQPEHRGAVPAAAAHPARARATAPTRATAGGAAAAYSYRPRRIQAYRRRRVPSEDRRNLGKTLVRVPSAALLCA